MKPAPILLKLRPHHLLCTLGFIGKGYSPGFVKNFRKIADQLRSTDDSGVTKFMVTVRADHICAPCPHLSADSVTCASEEKVRKLDHDHADILGICDGDTLTWGEAQQLLAEKMTTEKFDIACAPCSWKSLGVCKKALDGLRKSGAVVVLMAIGLFLHGPLSVEAGQAVPIDALRSPMQIKGKSKVVNQIRSALSALSAKKIIDARKAAALVQRDDLFGDYGFFIAAQSFIDEANEKLRAKKINEAEAAAKKAFVLFLRIYEDYPYSVFQKKISVYLAGAELLIANCQFAKTLAKQALTIYERAFQRLAVSSQSGVLLYNININALSNYIEMCVKLPGPICRAWVQKLVSLYPKSSEEIKVIAKFLPELAEKARPGEAIRRMTLQYKATDLDLRAFDAAMGVYLSGNPGKSIAPLRVFLDEFPKSIYRFRARYWLAQATRVEGDVENAQKILRLLSLDSPLTYYGLLASLEAKQPIEAQFSAILPEAIRRDQALQPNEHIHLDRAEQLLTAGLTDFAADELSNFKSRDALSSPFLMYVATLAAEASNSKTCFSILSELIQRGYDGIYSSHALKMIFPVAHFDFIESLSARLEIDPILILSLIKQESAFEAEAISSSGAIGLMQLMPATAIDVEPDVQRSTLIQAEANIKIGAKYLKRLLNKYNKNIVFALAAYNAGPVAVDRWIREGRAERGMLEFIESIPYRETREYVAAIIRNVYWYSRKIRGEAYNRLDQFWVEPNAKEQP